VNNHRRVKLRVYGRLINVCIRILTQSFNCSSFSQSFATLYCDIYKESEHILTFASNY
jgi:hypothetical protein